MDADRENGVKQNYGKLLARLTLFDNRWEHRVGAAVTSTENDNFLNRNEIGSNQGKKYHFNYQTSLKFILPVMPEINHTAILALENERQEFTQRGPVFFGFNPNQEQDMNITSYVAEYRMDFWERVFLSGSVRHDDNDAFPDTTTHRATLAWVVKDYGTRFHASYGTGVKNPTFIDRFGFFSSIGFGASFIGNSNLEPESSRGWDLGIEQSLFDNRLILDVTWFNEKLLDEINGFVFDPVLNANTAVNVSGTSRREGYEFFLRARLLDELDLSGSYTYTDATQPDDNGFQVREVRRAENIASLNLNYRFLDQRANLNLGVNYNGPQDDIYFPAPAFASTRVELDSYTLVNLAGSYEIGPSILLYARIENLLDSDYEEVFGFQTPGIGAWMGVKLNFNK